VSELPRATRSYVVLGLLFVVALALAYREHARSSDDSGKPDEWTRVLRVIGGIGGERPRIGGCPGFRVDTQALDDVTAAGRALLDDPDASPLAAAIAYADEQGYGFLLLDLRDDWDLSNLAVAAPPASMYAVIGIGDVAWQGTRVSFGAPVTGPFEYFEPPIDEIAVQLALFEHPDLRALYHTWMDGPVVQRNRWALDKHNGNYEHERSILQTNQRQLAEVDELWPSEPMPGTLAGRWEHVRAVPVVGGIVIEILPMWLDMSRSVRVSNLRSADVGELAFIPNEALVAGVDPIAARRPCVGLRDRAPTKRVQGRLESDERNLDVSPDGRTLALRRGPASSGLVDIYRFSSDSPDACALEWAKTAVPPPYGVPRPSNSGSLSWVYSTDQVWWWHEGVSHRLAYAGVAPDSGALWVSDNLLAALGEVAIDTPEDRNRSRAKQAAIMLLKTDIARFGDSNLAPRVRFAASTLFPKLEREDPAAKVIDFRPVGSETLLVMTKACPASHALGDRRLQYPCMHRVRFRSPLRERIGSKPMPKPLELAHHDLEVRTLGPIASYLSLDIAADGTRAVYVAIDSTTLDPAPRLFTVAIERSSLGPAERVADAHRESQLQLSADGHVVVVESPLVIPAYGERPTARAFVLP
jgi:hypothetical protein